MPGWQFNFSIGCHIVRREYQCFQIQPSGDEKTGLHDDWQLSPNHEIGEEGRFPLV
jgi:hypothetical protein